jgi:UDP-2-acetamido-2,6-beta-L-arabino-hexul-4-ose reductase
MIKIGITGQSGFIGTHLYNELGLLPDEFTRIEFEDNFFEDESKLCKFVKRCDVIIHLAAVNRHPDPKALYEKNIELVEKLIVAMQEENVHPYILFASSTQELLQNDYGKSKNTGRLLLEKWASFTGTSFTGMIIPNVFGPFGVPNYNSFIATFCYKLTHKETPEILIDNNVDLIYVGSLCQYIIRKIRSNSIQKQPKIETCMVETDFQDKVTSILSKLQEYKNLYFDKGFFPPLNGKDDVNLFNTFRSYIDYDKKFPVKLDKHSDARGTFVETLKLNTGGQVSFSTTLPGITRGNHFHTRKIERFTVISGKAKIQLKKRGTSQVFDFYVDGNEPAYVDMPIWFTHNITNIGTEELYTQFWINEWYDPNDGDTFFYEI